MIGRNFVTVFQKKIFRLILEDNSAMLCENQKSKIFWKELQFYEENYFVVFGRNVDKYVG